MCTGTDTTTVSAGSSPCWPTRLAPTKPTSSARANTPVTSQGQSPAAASPIQKGDLVVRIDGELRETGWETALAAAAIRTAHG